MKAAALQRFGSVEDLELMELPVPEVDAGEVRIRLAAAGVGVWDAMECAGTFHEMGYAQGEPRFPYVPGADGAGTVEAVGEQVTRFAAGERVFAFSLLNPRGGCYAEYLVIDADRVGPLPRGLDLEQAGALPVDGVTALRGLDDTLGLRAGESLMVFGASGGVGHLAVQLAKRLGARVLAVASGADGVELSRRLGADAAVDGREEDVAAAARSFAPEGLDAALFTAAGANAENALGAMADRGRVAHPNGVELETGALDNDVSVQSYDGVPDRAVLEKLVRLIEAGPFEVHVAQTFPLEKFADAHRALDEHYLGKLVLRTAER